jgi:16S rRNA processing protein RimM
VRRPHGVKGEVFVAVDTDRPNHVFQPGRVLHLGDGEGNLERRTLTLGSIRATTGGAILRFDGVQSREQADQLRGHALLIEAAEAQPAGPDEVHHRDLVGLTAVADGETLGKVEEIVEMPAGELLVVRGAGRKEILIPFVRDIVQAIDLDRRELRLRLPEGFLEI